MIWLTWAAGLAKRGASGLFAFLGTRTGRIVLFVAASAFLLWRVHEHGIDQGRAAQQAEHEAAIAAATEAARKAVDEDLHKARAITKETREALARDLASVDVRYDVDLEVIRARIAQAPPALAGLPVDPVVVRQLEAARARAHAAGDRLRGEGAR